MFLKYQKIESQGGPQSSPSEDETLDSEYEAIPSEWKL